MTGLEEYKAPTCDVCIEYVILFDHVINQFPACVVHDHDFPLRLFVSSMRRLFGLEDILRPVRSV